MSAWMQTYPGRVVFEPLNPRHDQLAIEDIAHALGMICRFGGHTVDYYSVAEHSVHVSHVCDPQEALAGLLHDAAEAYLGDMIRPMKHTPAMAHYREAEDWLLGMILAREGLSTELPASVLYADNAVLAAERDCPTVVGGAVAPWAELPPPARIRIRNWSPASAKACWLRRYRELGGVG